VSIHARGVERVSLALALIRDESVEAAKRATSHALHQVARQQRTLLSMGWHPYGTKTGSVPPEPPWRITGAFSRSVGVREPELRMTWRGLLWEGWVGAGVVYARIHELGGWTGRKHRTYLPPRPSLRPAWYLAQPDVELTYYHEMYRGTRPPRMS
jgi:hypothetical protein